MKRAMKSSESKEQLVGDLRSRSGGRIMPMPVTVSGVSCVSFFWLSATFLLLSGLVIAGGFSNWISNRVERSPLRNPQRIELSNGLDSVDLGLYYLCFNLTACPDSICSDSCGASGFCGCHTYFTYNPATNFTNNGRTTPTNMKKVESVEEIKFLFSASIIYAIGIILLFISLMIGILAFCKPRIRGWSLFIFSFLFQVFAAVFLITALILLPLFFNSTFAKQFCGEESAYYRRGQCYVDWSLYLAMVATACSLYLPALSIFAMNISDGLNAHVCC